MDCPFLLYEKWYLDITFHLVWLTRFVCLIVKRFVQIASVQALRSVFRMSQT